MCHVQAPACNGTFKALNDLSTALAGKTTFINRLNYVFYAFSLQMIYNRLFKFEKITIVFNVSTIILNESSNL